MADKITIAIIVAVAQNGVIGAKGDMPWKLSSDLKRFKRDTMGKAIIMGRKTFQSIGQALPGRLNIVVTRNKEFSAKGVEIAASLEAAIEIAKAGSNDRKLREICIIGGGELYRQAIGLADRLYITHVSASPDGDTYFPEVNWDEWQNVLSEDVPAGKKDEIATCYVVYERKAA